MKNTIIALALLSLVAAQTWAADLTKINRTIAKEPTYETEPKYCLLVFGKEAAHRVWLVWDGDYLYVDKNGNGDLTEEGEKIAKKTGDDAFFQEEGTAQFEIDELKVGPLTHKQLNVMVSSLALLASRISELQDTLAKNPEARAYGVSCQLQTPGRTGTGPEGRVLHSTRLFDLNGTLQFAEQAREAPILHLGGPQQITFTQSQELVIDRNHDIQLAVATPGHGPGTSLFMAYEGVIPINAVCKLAVTYPPKSPGDSPKKELYELKHRC